MRKCKPCQPVPTLALLLILLSGCGGGGSGGTTENPGTSALVWDAGSWDQRNWE